MPTSHQAVDPRIFPAWRGSTSAERVAVDRRRDSEKARDGVALFNSRGQKVPMFTAPRPRKESKTIGFGGALWVLSVAGDRKYPRRRHLLAQGVRWKESPSHGFSVALETGVTDCHSRCAHRPRNDRVFCKGWGRRDTWIPPHNSIFFVGQGPCALPGVWEKNPPVTALP